MTIDNDVKQLIKAGRLTDAGQAAYQAAVTGRAGVEVLGLGAAAAYQAGADDLALELFSRLDARGALDAGQWAMMGHAAERMGISRIALPAYRRSLDLDPDAAAVHYNLGSLQLRRHQWTEAITHLRAACDAKPDWQRAWENLAQALVGTEHYETVVPFLADCMARFPDNPVFAFQHAAALLHKGERAGAEAAYRDLTVRLPDNAVAWAGLAAAVIQDGRKDEAAALIAEAAAKGAQSRDLDEMAATLKLDAGDVAAAIAGYEAVLADQPDHRLARVNLVDALLQAGDHKRALKVCDDRLAAVSGDPEMLAYRAIVMTDRGRATPAALSSSSRPPFRSGSWRLSRRLVLGPAGTDPARSGGGRRGARPAGPWRGPNAVGGPLSDSLCRPRRRGRAATRRPGHPGRPFHGRGGDRRGRGTGAGSAHPSGLSDRLHAGPGRKHRRLGAPRR